MSSELSPEPNSSIESNGTAYDEEGAAVSKVADQLQEEDNPKNDEALVVTSFDRIEAKPVRWLWPGWIPRGALSIVEGDPGLGKSVLLLDIAARVTQGAKFPLSEEGSFERGAVTVLSSEDTAEEIIKPRLEAAGAQMDRMFRVTRDNPIRFPDDIGRLQEHIAMTNSVLVIIDPLDGFWSGKIDENRGPKVRQLLSPLARAAEQTGAAIVVIRHLNKKPGVSATYRGAGSIGIGAQARSIMLVGTDPKGRDEDARILAMTKANWESKPNSIRFFVETTFVLSGNENIKTAKIDWAGEAGYIGAEHLVAIQNDKPKVSKRNRARSLLQELLAKGPQPSMLINEKAREVGIGERTLNSARKDLGIEPYPEGGVWYCKLPEKKQ
jgi:RecA-family ATPase